VKVLGWGDVAKAKAVIIEGIARAASHPDR
jgi:hypothetical protein